LQTALEHNAQIFTLYNLDSIYIPGGVVVFFDSSNAGVEGRSSSTSFSFSTFLLLPFGVFPALVGLGLAM